MTTVKTIGSDVCSEALRAARGLVVYRGIIKDPVFLEMLRFLKACAGKAEPGEVLDAYGELFFRLSEKETGAEGGPLKDAWQNHLLDLILFDDNAFSRKAAAFPPEQVNTSLKEAAAGDLSRLEVLFRVEAEVARRTVLALLEESRLPVGGLPSWKDLDTGTGCGDICPGSSCLREIKHLFAVSPGWDSRLKELAGYYRNYGSGIFGKYGALRWSSRGGCLEGIGAPDTVSFEELVGYQAQRQEVVENTERFLAGLPANNVLLYGDRGTGKSSTVKALLNQYPDRGLRLVEVAKSDLGDFLLITRQLRRRPQRFIIFIDDLSFEESEVEYKELKAVLEGGLESRPANVLIYATSNRRHLVREFFSDAKVSSGRDQEVRRNDTVQEKLSLADRFGITVLYPSPDRELYLDIVRGLASRRGISLDEGELERRALLWETWHNGRSGRTARQLVDHLTGEHVLLDNP